MVSDAARLTDVLRSFRAVSKPSSVARVLGASCCMAQLMACIDQVVKKAYTHAFGRKWQQDGECNCSSKHLYGVQEYNKITFLVCQTAQNERKIDGTCCKTMQDFYYFWWFGSSELLSLRRGGFFRQLCNAFCVSISRLFLPPNSCIKVCRN